MCDNRKISDVIFQNIMNCFGDMTKRKYRIENYSFLHNTFVITSKGINVELFYQDTIGADILNINLQNISENKSFDYYSWDSIGLAEISTKALLRQVLFDGTLLESVKMYLQLQAIIGFDQINSFEKLLQQRMYIELLKYPSHCPIITDNAIKIFTNTNSFIHYISALDLKIKYASLEQEHRKEKNSRLLNMLLYILTVIGSIGTLDTVHSELGLPFKCGLALIVTFFGGLGVYWFFKEKS